MIVERVNLQAQGSLDYAHVDFYIRSNFEEIGLKKRPIILVCPGGGYEMTSDREGEPLALRFVSMGYHVAVLRYSCRPAVFPTALLECAETFRIIHDKAGEWGIDADKIILQGSSAGGHLAASMAVFWDKDWLSGKSGLSKEILKPFGLMLSYPVITSGEKAHHDSFKALLGDEYSDKDKLELVSLEKQVSENTPQTFVWHTVTDGLVPVENSIYFALALKDKGVPVEMHIFPHGGHGLSTADIQSCFPTNVEIDHYVAGWLDMAAKWLDLICYGTK